MNGALLQLFFNEGGEDYMMENDAELTFFKQAYKQHTAFSIFQNRKVIGNRKFDSNVNFKIPRENDLLKDTIFRVEIDDFNFTKTETERVVDTITNLTNPMYYEYNNEVNYIFLINNEYYIIPKNLITNPINVEQVILNEKFKTSLVNEIKEYVNEDLNMNQLRTNNNYSSELTQYLNKKNGDRFSRLYEYFSGDNNFILMDKKKFSNWFTEKYENYFILEYQNLFNTKLNKNLYNINFDNNNEVKKYISFLYKVFDEEFYTNNSLDADYSFNSVINDDTYTFDQKKTIILNSVLYNSRFLYYLLKNIYDFNNNYTYFFNKNKITEDNIVFGTGTKSVDEIIWKDFIEKFELEAFENEDNTLLLPYIDFKNKVDIVKSDIENRWNALKLVDSLNVSQVPLIFSIIYTFLDRYLNYKTHETLNFKNLFDTETSYLETLNTNFNNFSGLNFESDDTSSLFYSVGNYLDVNFLYSYIVYRLTDLFETSQYFENIYGTSEKNVQFIYWFRNKIANMVFIRFMNLVNSGQYPDFSVLGGNRELINFFLTFRFDSIITLDEIRLEFIKLMYNKSYFITLPKETYTSDDYEILVKGNSITDDNTFSSSHISNLEYDTSVILSTTEYSQDSTKVTIINYLGYDLTNVEEGYISFNGIRYDISNVMFKDTKFVITCDTIDVTFDDSIILYFKLNYPIEKYYFENDNETEITIIEGNNVTSQVGLKIFGQLPREFTPINFLLSDATTGENLLFVENLFPVLTSIPGLTKYSFDMDNIDITNYFTAPFTDYEIRIINKEDFSYYFNAVLSDSYTFSTSTYGNGTYFYFETDELIDTELYDIDLKIVNNSTSLETVFEDIVIYRNYYAGGNYNYTLSCEYIDYSSYTNHTFYIVKKYNNEVEYILFDRANDIKKIDDNRTIYNYNFDFTNYNYFIYIRTKTGEETKYKITDNVDEKDDNTILSLELYQIYDNQISIAESPPNAYRLLFDFNFANSEKISIIKIKNNYESFDIVSTIASNNSDESYLTIQYLINKYFIDTYFLQNASYKVLVNSVEYPLSQPEYVYDGSDLDSLTFKFLGDLDIWNYISDSDEVTYIVYNNNTLPNLLDYTSYFNNVNKTYDIMDYFIQKPKIIYTSYDGNKNCNAILYNLPFIPEDYITIDNKVIFRNVELNSNQLLRYNNQLISSSLDDDIYNHNNFSLDNSVTIMNDFIDVANIESVKEIIDLVEYTNESLRDTYVDEINNLDTYGKTIAKIVDNSNSINELVFPNITLTKDVNIYNSFDYNIFTKLTVDFYNNSNVLDFDSSIDSMDSIFTTYNQIYLNDRINTNVYNFLFEYTNEIKKQIENINNNASLYSLSGKATNNDFKYFATYQDDKKETVYENNDYYFDLYNGNDFDYYYDLDRVDKINENIITISGNTITSENKLGSVNEIFRKNNVNYEKDLYDVRKNKFNFYGPLEIKNNQIAKDKLDLFNFTGNKLLIDDTNNIYELDTSYNIDNSNNLHLKRGTVTDKFYVNFLYFDVEEYLYVFRNEGQFIRPNDYLVLGDSILYVQHVSTEYIYLYSNTYLNINRNSELYKATSKVSVNYNDYKNTGKTIDINYPIKKIISEGVNIRSLRIILDEPVDIRYFDKQLIRSGVVQNNKYKYLFSCGFETIDTLYYHHCFPDSSNDEIYGTINIEDKSYPDPIYKIFNYDQSGLVIVEDELKPEINLLRGHTYRFITTNSDITNLNIDGTDITPEVSQETVDGIDYYVFIYYVDYNYLFDTYKIESKRRYYINDNVSNGNYIYFYNNNVEVIQYTVTKSSNVTDFSFYIDGEGPNPTLTLYRGNVYEFYLDTDDFEGFGFEFYINNTPNDIAFIFKNDFYDDSLSGDIYDSGYVDAIDNLNEAITIKDARLTDVFLYMSFYEYKNNFRELYQEGDYTRDLYYLSYYTKEGGNINAHELWDNNIYASFDQEPEYFYQDYNKTELRKPLILRNKKLEYYNSNIELTGNDYILYNNKLEKLDDIVFTNRKFDLFNFDDNKVIFTDANGLYDIYPNYHTNINDDRYWKKNDTDVIISENSYLFNEYIINYDIIGNNTYSYTLSNVFGNAIEQYNFLDIDGNYFAFVVDVDTSGNTVEIISPISIEFNSSYAIIGNYNSSLFSLDVYGNTYTDFFTGNTSNIVAWYGNYILNDPINSERYNYVLEKEYVSSPRAVLFDVAYNTPNNLYYYNYDNNNMYGNLIIEDKSFTGNDYHVLDLDFYGRVTINNETKPELNLLRNKTYKFITLNSSITSLTLSSYTVTQTTETLFGSSHTVFTVTIPYKYDETAYVIDTTETYYINGDSDNGNSLFVYNPTPERIVINVENNSNLFGINGLNNPELTLYRGDVYRFVLDSGDFDTSGYNFIISDHTYGNYNSIYGNYHGNSVTIDEFDTIKFNHKDNPLTDTSKMVNIDDFNYYTHYFRSNQGNSPVNRKLDIRKIWNDEFMTYIETDLSFTSLYQDFNTLHITDRINIDSNEIEYEDLYYSPYAWYYKESDNIFNQLVDFDINDYNDDLKYNFTYVEDLDRFIILGDYVNSSDYDGNYTHYLLSSNAFQRKTDYYTYERIEGNVTYNYNRFSNTINLDTSGNDYYIFDGDGVFNYDNNDNKEITNAFLFFDAYNIPNKSLTKLSFYKELSIKYIDNNENYTFMPYTLTYNNEIDDSFINLNNTQKLTINLDFITGNTTTIGNIKHYYFNGNTVTNIDIVPVSSHYEVLKTPTINNFVLLLENARIVIANKIYNNEKLEVRVTTTDSGTFSFDIDFTIGYIDTNTNYNRYDLYSYDNVLGNFQYMREPFIISGNSNYQSLLQIQKKPANPNFEFILNRTYPANIFTQIDGNDIVHGNIAPNINVDINSELSQKYVKFMDINNNSENIANLTIDTNNYIDNTAFWEMLDYCDINNDIITINENIRNIFDKINNLIMLIDGEYKYVEILEKNDIYLTISETFQPNTVLLFVNIHNNIVIEKEISVEQIESTYYIDDKTFGTLRIGEVIGLDKTRLLITGYNLQYNMYEIVFLNSEDFKRYYRYFYSFGLLSDFAFKNSLVNYNEKYNLHTVTSAQNGSFIISGNDMGYYEGSFNDNVSNFITDVDRNFIKLYKIGSDWFYYDKPLKPSSIVVKDNIIFRIDYVERNKVYWDDLNLSSLDSLTSETDRNYYLFSLPDNIFKNDYLEISGNTITNYSDINGIISVKGNNSGGTLNDTFYNVIDGEIVDGNLITGFYGLYEFNEYENIKGNFIEIGKNDYYDFNYTITPSTDVSVRFYFNEDILGNYASTSLLPDGAKEFYYSTSVSQEYYLYNTNTSKYIYPIYLESDTGRSSYTDVAYDYLDLYQDASTTEYTNEPAGNYNNLDSSYYLNISGNGYTYPYYLNINRLNGSIKNNEHDDLIMDGIIKTIDGKKMVQITKSLYENFVKYMNIYYADKILVDYCCFRIRQVFLSGGYGYVETFDAIGYDEDSDVKLIIPRYSKDNYVNSTNNYKLNNIDTTTARSTKLFIYFQLEEGDNVEVVIFDIYYNGDFTFNLESEFFNFFENSIYQYTVFLENYIPVSLEPFIETDDTVTFGTIPFDISEYQTILLEEKTTYGEIIIHLVNISLENGMLVIDKTFNEEYSDNYSDFYINKIIPVRIRGNIIQLLTPQVIESSKIKKSDNTKITSYLQVPIERQFIVSQQSDYTWKNKIKSDHLVLLNNYDMFLEIDGEELTFEVDGNDYYIISDKILERDYVYVKNESGIKNLYGINRTLLLDDVTDETILKYLNEDWNDKIEKIELNITTEDVNQVNTFKIVGISSYVFDGNNNYYLNNINNSILNVGYEGNDIIVITDKDITDQTINKLYIDNTQSSYIVTNKTEPSLSVKSFVDIADSVELYRYQLFNNAKSLDTWSSITHHSNDIYADSQYLNFVDLVYGNVSGNQIGNSNSVFINQEIETLDVIGNNLITDIDQYTILTEIRDIEEQVLTYINKIYIYPFFWDDPLYYVNLHLSNTNSGWSIYKKCLVKDTEDTSDTDIFQVIDSNTIRRINYLDNQFDISYDGNYITISRDKTLPATQIANFISNPQSISFVGIDIQDFLLNLETVATNKDSFISDLSNGVDFNYDFDLLNAEKLLIAKQWDNVKNEYDNLNKDYVRNLYIDYTKDENYIQDDNYYGCTFDSLNELTTFGVDSYNNFYSFDTIGNYEKYYLTTRTFENNNEYLEYSLDDENLLYKYKVTTQNPFFDSKYNIKLDIMNGDNVFNDIDLDLSNIYSTQIEFYSNELYDDVKDISLELSQDINITSSTFLGNYYGNFYVSGLDLSTVSFYSQGEKLTKVSGNGVSFDLISPVNIEDELYIVIKQYVGIKSQTLDSTKLYLDFTSQYDSLKSISNVDTYVYLELDSYTFTIKEDVDGSYIEYASELDDINKNFVISVFYDFSTSISSDPQYYVYDLVLDSELDDVYYNVEVLPVNYKVDNVRPDKLRIINLTEVYAYFEDELVDPTIFTQIIRKDRDEPSLLNDVVDYDRYVYTLDYDYRIFTDDSEVLLSSVSGNKLVYGNGICVFDLDDYYTYESIDGNDIRIENYYNIDVVVLDDIIDNWFINTYDSNDYYDGNNLKDTTITFNGNFTQNKIVIGNSTIDIELIDNELNNQELNGLVSDYEDIVTNNLTVINRVGINNVSYNYDNKKISFSNVIDNYDSYYVQYLDVEGNEIGNYMYSLDLDYIVLEGKSLILQDNLNNDYDAFYVGNNIISVVNKINDDRIYVLKSTDNDIYINLLPEDFTFESTTYSYGEIIEKGDLFYGTVNKDFNIVEGNHVNLYFMSIFEKLDLELNNNDITFTVGNNIIKTYTDNTTVTIEEPEWKEDIGMRLFDRISLFFNDQEIDTLNYHTYLMETSLELPTRKREQFYAMTKPELINGKWVFYLPLLFYFIKSSYNYIPFCVMENVEVKIKGDITSLSNLVTNYVARDDVPKVMNLELYYDTILLDEFEKNMFAQGSHDYVIRRNILSHKYLVNTLHQEIPLHLNGVIDTIYWICERADNGDTYLSITDTSKRDKYYNEYMTDKETYESGTTDYTVTYIFGQIEYNKENFTDIYQLLITDEFFKKYDTDLCLYLYVKYLENIDEEAVRELKLRLYLKNNLIEDDIKKLSPIEFLNFKIGGKDLMENIGFKYNNVVVPAQKFTGSLEKGLGAYSFALDPLDKVNTGHLNFKMIDSSHVILDMNENVVDQPVYFTFYYKEINLLKIESTQASLMWKRI